MVTDSSNGADTIVTTDIITGPQSLKGKRMGLDVGSVMGELFVQEMLKPYGLTMNDMILVDIPPEDIPVMMGYKIDAGHTRTPYTQRAQGMGYKVILRANRDASFISECDRFSTESFEQQADNVRAYLAAVLKHLILAGKS
jgi:ABC-type nitrate/sulfonate/bicarbonate transport system substrate-binding protein